MTLNDIFLVEEYKIFFEETTLLEKKKTDKPDPDSAPTWTKKWKRTHHKHKSPDWRYNNSRFRSGRERTVSAVVNLVRGEGVSVSPDTVRNYIYKMYNLWKSRSPKAKWILDLEEKAIEKGFDPRKYDGGPKGNSVGKGGPGDPEYDGRAFYFVSLIHGFKNHFLSKNKKKNNGE